MVPFLLSAPLVLTEKKPASTETLHVPAVCPLTGQLTNCMCVGEGGVRGGNKSIHGV